MWNLSPAQIHLSDGYQIHLTTHKFCRKHSNSGGYRESQDWPYLDSESNCPCAPATPLFNYNYFSISVRFFSGVAPHFFSPMVRHWIDYLVCWIVMLKKMRGHSGKQIARKSRNSCVINGRDCAWFGQLTQGVISRNPRTKYKRSKNVFAVTLYCAYYWPRFVTIVTVSCALYNRESRYPCSYWEGTGLHYLSRNLHACTLLSS